MNPSTAVWGVGILTARPDAQPTNPNGISFASQHLSLILGPVSPNPWDWSQLSLPPGYCDFRTGYGPGDTAPAPVCHFRRWQRCWEYYTQSSDSGHGFIVAGEEPNSSSWMYLPFGPSPWPPEPPPPAMSLPHPGPPASQAASHTITPPSFTQPLHPTPTPGSSDQQPAAEVNNTRALQDPFEKGASGPRGARP